MEGDESKIENVTFELSPLHGDCDLVVSRNESQMFPTKDDGNYEFRSQRIGALIDHITVERPKDNATPAYLLNTTYYIGVYGYTQTTFSLLVTVNRRSFKTAKLSFNRYSTTLYEGLPFTKRLHNELEMFFGKFQVDITDDEEQAIVIDIYNTEGKTTTFIREGTPPDLPVKHQ